MVREIMKTLDLDVGGSKVSYRITKMNAFNGSYLFKFVSEKVIPVIESAVGLMSGQEDTPEAQAIVAAKLGDTLMTTLGSLSLEDMTKIMRMCLQTVEQALPAGYQKVVDVNGNFGVADLEYDANTCLRLVYEVIMFNVSDFFGEGGLVSSLMNKVGLLQKQ